MPTVGATIPLFEVNPALDRAGLCAAFVREGRVQVRDVLSMRTAEEIHRILSADTPWGLSWQAGGNAPEHVRPNDLAGRLPAERAEIGKSLSVAMSGTGYGFAYSAYPMVDAYTGQWHPGHPLDLILEHVNDEPFLDLVREITSLPNLVKADAQATLFGPANFLSRHNDTHLSEGRRIAYVLNFTREPWREDWGGYLVFFDGQGDIVAGYKPRFNTLNMFAVPQWHSVTYVPPFAPRGRFAITGWFRDR